MTILRTSYSYCINDKVNDDIRLTNDETVGFDFRSLKWMYDDMQWTKYIDSITLILGKLSLS